MTEVDEFRAWLEQRGCYAPATVTTWTRIAQRLEEACPDGAYPATPEDAADLLAPAACMPHTRYNLRAGLRQFYEFGGRRVMGRQPCPFSDCIHHARCEHQEPNLCCVAVPGHLDENGDFEWSYPTVEFPTSGAPGPVKLRWADIDRDLLQRPLTPECSTCPRWSPVRGCLCHPGGVEPDSDQCMACAARRRQERRAAKQRRDD